MALSDAQQAQVYDALVVNGGQYYKTDAIINVIRDEVKKQLDSLAAQVAGIAAGGIRYPGANYLAFDALANTIREGKGEATTPIKVDTAALAKELAPILAENIDVVSDADLDRIAARVADEQGKRLGGEK